MLYVQSSTLYFMASIVTHPFIIRYARLEVGVVGHVLLPLEKGIFCEVQLESSLR